MSVKALILCGTALGFTLTADAANAGGLVAGLAALKTAATATALGSFLYNLAGSLLFSFIASKLAPKPKQPDLKREIAAPQSRQPYRFVYGRNRVYGSPLPLRVKGTTLYGCLLLNSRPSEGNFDIFFDKRPATVTSGDIYDFTGNGAILDIEDFPPIDTVLLRPRVWIGRGDQTTPPDDLVAEAPEFFDSTDGWQGRTVMWLRFEAGEAKRRQDRWPAVPPEIEVEGDWTKVWDPREESQDPDDPDTWTYSDNQALCLLDALRQNPIRRYSLRNLHLPSFIEAADVADEEVVLYHLSEALEEEQVEKRYRVAGMLVWNGSEVWQQVAPLVAAGGGDLVRIGGRLGYASGEYRDSVFTVKDIVEEGGIELEVLTEGRNLPRAVRASYINPQRDWQSAEVPEIEVVGGQGVSEEGIQELELGFVTSPTQAMRLQQITARKLALQRRLSVTLWPEAFAVVAGSTVLVDMPPAFTRLNGTWQVETSNPALWASDISGGVAMRVPVALRQIAPEVYAWDPETDEFEVFNEPFDPSRPVFVDSDMTLPTGLTATPVGVGGLTIDVTQANDSFVDGVEVFWSLTNDIDTAEPLFDAFPGAGQSASFTHSPIAILTHYYWARSVRQPNFRSPFTSPAVSDIPNAP
jgi:hypothetical protein